MPVSAFDSVAYPASPQPTRVDPVRMVLTVEPAVELWTVSDADVALTLRTDSSSDNTLVTLCLVTARKLFEEWTGLCLINQTWRASLDRVPQGRELTLPRAPLVSVSSIKYLADNSTEAAMAAGDYALGSVGAPRSFGRVRVRASAEWPDAGDVPDALQITFVAGFGTAAANVPGDIRFGVLLMAKYIYERSIASGDAYAPGFDELPAQLAAFVETYRLARIA